MEHPLLKFMSENSLDQKEVASHFGKTRQAVGKWISGKTSPNMMDFFNFRKYWGKVHTDKLVCEWLQWLEHKRNEVN